MEFIKRENILQIQTKDLKKFYMCSSISEKQKLFILLKNIYKLYQNDMIIAAKLNFLIAYCIFINYTGLSPSIL